MNEFLRGFSPHDLVLAGVVIGMWLSNRGRRYMGERIGRLEELIAVLTGRKLTPPGDRSILDSHPPKD